MPWERVDAIAVEALANLTTVMSSLLPPPPAPTLAPALLITPVRVSPTGIGGYVGAHPSPQGDVFGRRITARVQLSVPGSDATALDDTVEQITQAVLARDRAELAQLGILKLSLFELGPRPTPPAPGPPTQPRRELSFDVLYEFLKLPEEDGGVIGTIPIDIEAGLLSDAPLTLISGPFVVDPLPQFDVVDDPDAGTAAPSDWNWDAVLEGVVQTSAIRGGAESTAPNKPGTALLLRTTPARPVARNISMAATMDATAEGGIGFVFRFIDADNFYYALLDSRTGFRRIGRKVAGVFGALDEGGLDATTGFDIDRLMRVRLLAQGPSFRLIIDGETVLEGSDTTLDEAGRAGFLVRNCTGARFFDLHISML